MKFVLIILAAIVLSSCAAATDDAVNLFGVRYHPKPKLMHLAQNHCNPDAGPP